MHIHIQTSMIITGKINTKYNEFKIAMIDLYHYDSTTNIGLILTNRSWQFLRHITATQPKGLPLTKPLATHLSIQDLHWMRPKTYAQTNRLYTVYYKLCHINKRRSSTLFYRMYAVQRFVVRDSTVYAVSRQAVPTWVQLQLLVNKLTLFYTRVCCTVNLSQMF